MGVLHLFTRDWNIKKNLESTCWCSSVLVLMGTPTLREVYYYYCFHLFLHFSCFLRLWETGKARKTCSSKGPWAQIQATALRHDTWYIVYQVSGQEHSPTGLKDSTSSYVVWSMTRIKGFVSRKLSNDWPFNCMSVLWDSDQDKDNAAVIDICYYFSHFLVKIVD